MRRMTLTPAYGRDYKSKKEILSDLLAGKDFIVHEPHGSTYINLAGLRAAEVVEINVRYRAMRSVSVFQVASIKEKEKA